MAVIEANSSWWLLLLFTVQTDCRVMTRVSSPLPASSLQQRAGGRVITRRGVRVGGGGVRLNLSADTLPLFGRGGWAGGGGGCFP